jgi:hypothetical protein
VGGPAAVIVGETDDPVEEPARGDDTAIVETPNRDGRLDGVDVLYEAFIVDDLVRPSKEIDVDAVAGGVDVAEYWILVTDWLDALEVPGELISKLSSSIGPVAEGLLIPTSPPLDSEFGWFEPCWDRVTR